MHVVINASEWVQGIACMCIRAGTRMWDLVQDVFTESAVCFWIRVDVAPVHKKILLQYKIK